MSVQPVIVVVPLTLPEANRYVAAWHRHHSTINSGFVWWCVGAVANGTVRGVAIVGRPTNRNNDDRQTVEVLRLASDGTPNVPSALLGACARASAAIGAARILTYTLDEETGSSLRGAGWTREANGIVSKWRKGTSRRLAPERIHMAKTKVRWARRFREPVDYQHAVVADDFAQDGFDFGAVS